jgi:hypothetical protein
VQHPRLHARPRLAEQYRDRSHDEPEHGGPEESDRVRQVSDPPPDQPRAPRPNRGPATGAAWGLLLVVGTLGALLAAGITGLEARLLRNRHERTG